MFTKNTSLKVLLSSSILASGILVPISALSQSDIAGCGPTPSGQLIPECVQGNAGSIVDVPTGAQTEPEVTPATNNAGFAISLDGNTVDSDPTIEDHVRKIDLALEEANVQVTFDGFEPRTRLGVETVGAPRAYTAGETVTLRSETNYPAFIQRGEFRIIDRSAVGGERLVTVVPVTPNGDASVVMPSGDDIVVVHRVYDKRGRYDETTAVPLNTADDRGLRSDVEELDDAIAVRNIRVRGGAVTVYADSLAPGSTISALGTSARPDGSGGAVIQRILPPGQHDVSVAISGAQDARLTRPIEVPGAEWFYAAVIDLTIERTEEGDEEETRTLGRFQYYVKGETSGGIKITSSLDTAEEELDEIFQRLDEKDPRSVLERIDPEDTYPTFGDDSSIVDDTPTTGRFYLEVEKDNNRFVWGDTQSSISGNTFVRNERTLYGAQAIVQSEKTTESGEPRFSAELFAAQPDQLPGRETFRGTGGSVYFLRRQDITLGTETLTVEVRDAVTGLVVDQTRLVAGRDYDVNYLQGVVTLSSPLTDSVNNNLIQTNVGGDQVVNLVVQYEFTPTSSDVDGYSFGGRVEGWVTDQIRLGLAATSDDTGTEDHTTYALDLRYQLTPNSFVQLDIARSEGPGFVQDFSIDGGLTIDSQGTTTGSGNAYRLAGQADLRDLGYSREGVIGAYAERRDLGFSSLDYSVTTTTGDESFYGAYARVAKTETQAGYALYADIYENDAGVERTEIGAEIEGNLRANLGYTLAAEYLDQKTETTEGDRFVLAARLDYEVNDRLSYYVYGQGTVSSNDLEDYNRYGLGFARALTENWKLGAEVSGGTGGTGGRILAEYSDGDGNSQYFGYELDRVATLNSGVATDENRGQYIVGGRKQINDKVAIFGENTYDVFSARRTLTSAYGLEYKATDFLTYDTSLEYGQVAGDLNGDLERLAVSFGARYETDKLRATGRLEFRSDDADEGSEYNDFDAIYFNGNLRYEIDEERRLLMSLAAANSSSDGSSVLDGSVVDAEVGYAYRPISNERLNVLARYRYLRDTFGQEIDGVAGAGERQESHVFSVEASYDLNRAWTLGGKIGARLSETSASDDDPYTSNDAWLGVINVRYHLVHKWDLLLEARHLDLTDAGFSETSFLGAAYRHVGNNVKVGVGYNFGSFSDDLTDLSRDDKGLFLNVIAKF